MTTKAVLRAQTQNRIHVRRLAEEMNGNDGLRAECNGLLHRGRIHRVGALINVDKHRLGAAIGNRLGGCHEGVGHGDHFIPRTDPRRQKRQPERIRAIPDADGMIAVAVGGEILFELRDERTAGECPAVDNLPRSRH